EGGRGPLFGRGLSRGKRERLRLQRGGAGEVQGDLRRAARHRRKHQQRRPAGLDRDSVKQLARFERGRRQAPGGGVPGRRDPVPAADRGPLEPDHGLPGLGAQGRDGPVLRGERTAHLQHHKALDLRPAQRDRGDEARRRLRQLRQDAVRPRRAGAGPDRGDPRGTPVGMDGLALCGLGAGEPPVLPHLLGRGQRPDRAAVPHPRRRPRRHRRQLLLRPALLEGL
ncbi:MAG: Assymetric_cell_division_FstX, partial [uncultured Rubrobacteraceae bacterium]